MPDSKEPVSIEANEIETRICAANIQVGDKILVKVSGTRIKQEKIVTNIERIGTTSNFKVSCIGGYEKIYNQRDIVTVKRKADPTPATELKSEKLEIERVRVDNLKKDDVFILNDNLRTIVKFKKVGRDGQCIYAQTLDSHPATRQYSNLAKDALVEKFSDPNAVNAYVEKMKNRIKGKSHNIQTIAIGLDRARIETLGTVPFYTQEVQPNALKPGDLIQVSQNTQYYGPTKGQNIGRITTGIGVFQKIRQEEHRTTLVIGGAEFEYPKDMPIINKILDK